MDEQAEVDQANAYAAANHCIRAQVYLVIFHCDSPENNSCRTLGLLSSPSNNDYLAIATSIDSGVISGQNPMADRLGQAVHRNR